jgi:hypothetical protein
VGRPIRLGLSGSIGRDLPGNLPVSASDYASVAAVVPREHVHLRVVTHGRQLILATALALAALALLAYYFGVG